MRHVKTTRVMTCGRAPCFGQDGGLICDKILPTGTSFEYLFLAYPVILNSINTRYKR